MVLGQRCSLCKTAGHNCSSCIRRLHGEIERIEAELVSKEAEVDRLQSLVAGLKVEETRRIVLNDGKMWRPKTADSDEKAKQKMRKRRLRSLHPNQGILLSLTNGKIYLRRARMPTPYNIGVGAL